MASRATWQPATPLQVSVTLMGFYGGTGNLAVTPARLIRSLLVGYESTEFGFENQVAMFDVTWQATRATKMYAAAGAEDAAGAWWQVPGLQAGISWHPTNVLTHMRVEWVRMADACCGNPPWQRHNQFTAGWQLPTGPIGDPLGGHGHAWRIAARQQRTYTQFELIAQTGKMGARNRYAAVRTDASEFAARMALHAARNDFWAQFAARRLQTGWTPSVDFGINLLGR